MKPTPGWLKPGDVVELGIDKLGTQKHKIVAFKARALTHVRGGAAGRSPAHRDPHGIAKRVRLQPDGPASRRRSVASAPLYSRHRPSTMSAMTPSRTRRVRQRPRRGRAPPR